MFTIVITIVSFALAIYIAIKDLLKKLAMFRNSVAILKIFVKKVMATSLAQIVS